MRTVRIPNCSYELYTAIRDKIMEIIPFSVINQDYSPNKQLAIFNFWDSDYIPKCLNDYILRPPKHREDIDRLQEELTKICKNYGI